MSDPDPVGIPVNAVHINSIQSDLDFNLIARFNRVNPLLVQSAYNGCPDYGCDCAEC